MFAHITFDILDQNCKVLYNFVGGIVG